MGTLLVLLVSLSLAASLSQGNCSVSTRRVQQLHIANGVLSLDGRKIITSSINETLVELGVLDGESGRVLSQMALDRRSIDWSSVLQLSPKGDAFAFLNDSKGMIVRLQEGLPSYPIIGGRDVAWSPDESMMAIASKLEPELWRLAICSSSGEVLTSFTVSTQDVTLLFWSPGEFITIVTPHSTGGVIFWYYPNGTLYFQVQISEGVYTSAVNNGVACNSHSTLAIGGLALITNAGYITTRDGGGFSPKWDSQHDIVIARGVPGVPCRLYDATLVPLLELPEASGHTVLGMTANGRLLTSDDESLYWWDVRIPLGSKFTFPRKLYSQIYGYGWLNHDIFLVLDQSQPNLLQELNIRTEQFGGFHPIGRTACVMGGELYNWADDGRVVVTADGEAVRSWYVGVGGTNGYCGNDHLWMTINQTLFVWNKTGQFLGDFALSTLRGNVLDVALHNISLFAVVTESSTLSLWNPVTLQFDRSEIRAKYVKWSPDGAWLAAWNVSSLIICKSNGELVLDIPLARSSGWIYPQLGDIWNADSNWLLGLDPPLLVSPKLGLARSSGGAAANQAFWNPYTMEVMSLMEATLQVWYPTPSFLEHVANKTVGVKFYANISLFGANFLPSSVETLLRWADSTGTPQCMSIQATILDPFTISLGEIILPSPATYTVHIRYPTTHPTSPWLNSEVQFTASCSGVSFPAIGPGKSLICVCPTLTHYQAPSNGNGNELNCVRCPPHAICDGSSTLDSETGWWQTAEVPPQLLPCAAGACLTGNRCAPCHDGPLCGLCKRGCGQHGFGRCQACNPITVDIQITLLGFFCWVVFCTIQSSFALQWSNEKRQKNNSSQLAAVIVSTTQMNALLLSVNVEVDVFKQTLFGYTEEHIPGGGVQSSIFSCILIHYGLRPEHVHFVKQIIMLILPVAGWILLSLVRTWLRCCGTTISVDIVKVPTIIVWSSLHSAITTSLFQTLSCKDVKSPGFRSRLRHDISVACDGPTYWSFVGVVTIPAIILTLVVIPLRIAWLLRYRPSASDSGHFRFLVKQYRMDWWYLVVFYRKVVLSAIVTFIPYPFPVAFTLLLAVLVHVMVRPSTALVVNLADTISLIVSAWIFGVAGTMGGMDKGGAITLCLVTVLSYCLQLGLLVYDRWHGGKVGKEKDEEAPPNDPIVDPPKNDLSTRLLN